MATRARGLPDDTEGRVTLAKFIAEGLPDTSMPGYGKTLTGERIADLGALVRTW